MSGASDNHTPAVFSVFLSYASEDRHALLNLVTQLREEGLDVWFDANELRGGDAWDDAIRRQIKSCAFFVAVISATTEQREEGYFRREWRLAVERAHDMADDRPFIIPVSMLDIRPEQARVPKTFLDLHWFSLSSDTAGRDLGRRLKELHNRRTLTTSSPFSSRQSESSQMGAGAVSSKWPWVIAGVITAALAIGLLQWRLPIWPVSAAASPVAAALKLDPRAIAVLPFANLSADPRDEYLCDGLSEELLSALGRDTDLRVVARTSAYSFKGRSVPIPEIAKSLGASKLVEGSIRRMGDQLKIVVQLVNGVNGYRLWSRDYPFEQRDIFDVQAEVARDVAAQLSPVSAHPSTVYHLGTHNLDAYDAYLRGRSFQFKPAVAQNLEAAANYFRQAVTADPGYASAWARLAAVLVRLHINGNDDSESRMQEAYASIQKALALDPDLPEAHTAFAFYYVRGYQNTDIAIRELEAARLRAPNDPDTLFLLAACELNLGNKDKAVRIIRQAVQVDPQNADTANLCATILDAASRYADAVAERDRAFHIGGWAGSLLERALTFRNWKGDLNLALKELDAAVPALREESERNYYWRLRASFLRGLGRLDEARAAILQIKPELIPAQYYYHTKSIHLAAIAEEKGEGAEAHRMYLAALEPTKHYQVANPKVIRAYTSLALIQAGLGQEEEARSTIRAALELVSPEANPYTSSRTGLRVLAQIDARYGRMDDALALVSREIAAGYWKRSDLQFDPDWTLLRRDPRFRAIAEAAPL